MSNPVPSSLALTTIADGANIVASDHRTNYAAIQAAVNALVVAAGGGASGQQLQAVDTTHVQWAYPPGFEFGYVEFTSAVSSTTATEASPLDVVSAGSITFDGTPVIVEFFSPLMQSNGATTVGISLWEDATDRGHLFDSGGSLLAADGGIFKRKIAPAAGAHTYKVRLWTAGGTNFVVNAGAGGVGARLPGFIRITKA